MVRGIQMHDLSTDEINPREALNDNQGISSALPASDPFHDASVEPRLHGSIQHGMHVAAAVA